MSIGKIIFSSIAIIQVVLVVLLYYFWINELIYVRNATMPVNLRDPKESFSFTMTLTGLLFPITLVMFVLHFFNEVFKNMTNMNRWLQVVSIISVLIIFGNIFNFIVFHPYRNYNPFTALTWLLD